MTTVIELYGGPGTGKSTSAALLYAMLKMAGENAELVREYVKDWAWEGRKPGDFDQLYFLGKGIRKESLLYGKVDWVVTDAPIFLGIYYARKYSPRHISLGVQEAVMSFYQAARAAGVVHERIFLERTKAYNPAGRYQTEKQAKKIDRELLELLDEMGSEFDSTLCGTRPEDLYNLLGRLGVSETGLADVYLGMTMQQPEVRPSPLRAKRTVCLYCGKKHENAICQQKD